MSERIAVFLSAFFSALLLSTLSVAAGETIRIDGSSGVRPLAKALGKAYADMPGTARVKVGKGLGTKARLKALETGKIDIATASHGVDPAALAKRGMALHTIARIAVVFGVNSGVSISSVSDRQICDIYAGKLKNWRVLGGPDLPIAPRSRPDKEVDAAVMRKGVGCFTSLTLGPNVKINKKSGQMARDLAATAGAFGMTTTTRVRRSKGKIRAVAYNGVAPTVANVENGTYTFTRKAYLVTKASPSTKVAAFLKFVRSAEGAAVLKANDAIPAQ